jgi:hypothetical protein
VEQSALNSARSCALEAPPAVPGLLDPGWLEAQGLELHPDQPPLLEQLWLLLPEGRVRLAKVGEELLAQVSCLRTRTTRSTGRPARQSLWELAPKTMHPVHRYPFMVMEIDRRLLPSGCRTTQTGAERQQRMVNGRGVAALAWPTWLLGVKPQRLLLGSCPAGVQVGSHWRSADA